MARLLTIAWLLPGVSIGDLWIAVVAVLSIGDLWIAVVAMLSIGLPNVVFWPPLFAQVQQALVYVGVQGILHSVPISDILSREP